MSNREFREKTGMRGQSKSNLLSGKQCGYLLILIFFCLFAVMPAIAEVDKVAYWAPWVTKTTTNSAAINWLGGSLGSGTVDYATSSYYNEHQSFEKTIASQIKGSYQHVPLTDLEPNTSYIYRVRPSDNADVFSNRTFRTMPVSGPFTYIVISDTHAQEQRFKYVADAIAANETDVLFILDGGDYTGHDSDDQWAQFFEAADVMLAKFPIFTTIGNHEYHNSGGDTPTGADHYHGAFDIPKNGALNYSFDCAGIRFIILDSPDPATGEDPHTSLTLAQSQAPWLEGLLKDNMAGVFTIHHHPIWDYFSSTNNPDLQPWEDLFLAYNISANFAGHTHTYQRYSVKGIPYFVVGNAGGAFADLISKNIPAWYVKGITRNLGYLKVTVDPAKNTATAQEILVGYVDSDLSTTVIPIDPPITYDTLTFPLSSNSTVSVTPSYQAVSKDAGTTIFSVTNSRTGTMPWTAEVTSGSSWLSITSGASGSNSGTVTCSFTENTGTSARTATIRITATGAACSPTDVTVIQASTGCTAVLAGNSLLYIPYISYDNPTPGVLSLWADFIYAFNPDSPSLIPFKLANAVIISNPSFSCMASTLSSNLTIHIPDLMLSDGVTHLWVDLVFSQALSTDGNYYWIVSSYGAVSN